MPPVKSKAMPKFVPAPAELVSKFESALDLMPEAELRKMFGYPAAFFNGQMFAGIFGESVMLRLSEEDRALIAKKGAQPFEPMPGRIMKEYVVVPGSILESPRLLDAWLRKGLAYVRTLPPKSGKPRKGRQPKK